MPITGNSILSIKCKLLFSMLLYGFILRQCVRRVLFSPFYPHTAMICSKKHVFLYWMLRVILICTWIKFQSYESREEIKKVFKCLIAAKILLSVRNIIFVSCINCGTPCQNCSSTLLVSMFLKYTIQKLSVLLSDKNKIFKQPTIFGTYQKYFWSFFSKIAFNKRSLAAIVAKMHSISRIIEIFSWDTFMENTRPITVVCVLVFQTFYKFLQTIKFLSSKTSDCY